MRRNGLWLGALIALASQPACIAIGGHYTDLETWSTDRIELSEDRGELRSFADRGALTEGATRASVEEHWGPPDAREDRGALTVWIFEQEDAWVGLWVMLGVVPIPIVWPEEAQVRLYFEGEELLLFERDETRGRGEICGIFITHSLGIGCI